MSNVGSGSVWYPCAGRASLACASFTNLVCVKFKEWLHFPLWLSGWRLQGRFGMPVVSCWGPGCCRVVTGCLGAVIRRVVTGSPIELRCFAEAPHGGGMHWCGASRALLHHGNYRTCTCIKKGTQCSSGQLFLQHWSTFCLLFTL